jgi:hypothetical protein
MFGNIWSPIFALCVFVNGTRAGCHITLGIRGQLFAAIFRPPSMATTILSYKRVIVSTGFSEKMRAALHFLIPGCFFPFPLV